MPECSSAATPRSRTKRQHPHPTDPEENSNNYRRIRTLTDTENFSIFTPLYESPPDMRETFDIFLIVMASLALVVFIALHFFEAGYG